MLRSEGPLCNEECLWTQVQAVLFSLLFGLEGPVLESLLWNDMKNPSWAYLAQHRQCSEEGCPSCLLEIGQHVQKVTKSWCTVRGLDDKRANSHALFGLPVSCGIDHVKHGKVCVLPSTMFPFWGKEERRWVQMTIMPLGFPCEKQCCLKNRDNTAASYQHYGTSRFAKCTKCDYVTAGGCVIIVTPKMNHK